MDFIAEENRIKIDLHGLTKDEARFEIINALEYSPENIKQLIIVHGYSLRKYSP